MSWKLYEGDCFDYLPLIEDGSVDMILCDLPYGTTACKWDTPLPLDKLWNEYKRIIKDNGAIVLTASQPFTSYLVMSNPEMFRYDYTWVKNRVTNFVHAHKMPLYQKEDILVFYNNPPIYNPLGIIKINKQIKPSKSESENENRFIRQKNKESYIQEYTNYPSNVLNFNNDTGFHPTQKPVKLFEYLIKTYTNENDLVLDNCAGSGTTGVACENTNRNSILMEKEPEYCQIIKDRIASVEELQLEQRKQKTLNEFNGQSTLDIPAK